MPKLHKVKKALNHSMPIVTRDDVSSYEEYMKQLKLAQEMRPIVWYHLLPDNVTMVRYEIRTCQ